MGRGKVLITLFILLLFGMAIPSLIVTGVLLLCSFDVTFGMVYGVMTLAYIVISAPFLYKQLRKENYLEVEDDNKDEDSDDEEDDYDYDDDIDAALIDDSDIVDDSECNKYL